MNNNTSFLNFIRPFESNIFVEGDHVVCTNSSHQVLKGNIYKIPKKFKNEEYIYVQTKSNKKVDRIEVFSSRFRLANKEEIQFFTEEGIGCNIKDIGKSFDKDTLYKKGDVVILKSNISPSSYGWFHGSIYSGAEYTIKRVTSQGKYLTECGEAILIDDFILNKVPPVEIKPKLLKFPERGWCKDPSSKMMTHFRAKYNYKYSVRKGKAGVAWNNNSCWTVEKGSNKTLYKNDELEKILFPKDIKTNNPFPIKSLKEAMEDSKEFAKVKVSNWISESYNSRPMVYPHFELPLDPPTASDRYIASAMALQQSVGRSLRVEKDEFTQQEPILLKRKSTRRKLIIS